MRGMAFRTMRTQISYLISLCLTMCLIMAFLVEPRFCRNPIMAFLIRNSIVGGDFFFLPDGSGESILSSDNADPAMLSISYTLSATITTNYHITKTSSIVKYRLFGRSRNAPLWCNKHVTSAKLTKGKEHCSFFYQFWSVIVSNSLKL